jgi:hypothetical protein
VNSSTELPSEWQDGRPPTFNHGLVWRKSEGSAAIAALKTVTYVFMSVSGNEYPSTRPHWEEALMTDGRVLLDIPDRQDAMRGIIVECHKSGESWVAVDADGAVVGFVLAGPDFHDQKAISLRYIGVSGNSRRRGNTCHPD